MPFSLENFLSGLIGSMVLMNKSRRSEISPKILERLKNRTTVSFILDKAWVRLTWYEYCLSWVCCSTTSISHTATTCGIVRLVIIIAPVPLAGVRRLAALLVLATHSKRARWLSASFCENQNAIQSVSRRSCDGIEYDENVLWVSFTIPQLKATFQGRKTCEWLPGIKMVAGNHARTGRKTQKGPIHAWPGPHPGCLPRRSPARMDRGVKGQVSEKAWTKKKWAGFLLNW